MIFDLNVMGDPRVRKASLRVNNTAVQGPQKLAQRILVLMFTDSRINTNLGIGTELTDDETFNLSDMEVVRNTYNIALASVKETVLLSTPADASDSEKLADIEVLIDGSEERGRAEILIIVTTQAGDTAEVTLPVEGISE